jgi:branched-chain amino acid transport system ATP-binding protein
MTGSQPLLTARGLRKSFGRLVAVDDVSFDVGHGDVLGIAGPNGAGKTTLFNLLTRLPFAPDAGTVAIDGRSLDRLSPRRVCRAGLVRTFQAEAAFDTLTAYDNVLVASAYGARHPGRRARRAATDEALAALALDDVREVPAGDLPLLAKKRLMIASALATGPRVVLLDEPAAGLNRDEQDQLAGDVRRIRDRGVAVVIIEHVLPLLTRLADRLMVLAEGRVLAEGPPREILADRRVIEAYVGHGASS